MRLTLGDRIDFWQLAGHQDQAPGNLSAWASGRLVLRGFNVIQSYGLETTHVLRSDGIAAYVRLEALEVGRGRVDFNLSLTLTDGREFTCPGYREFQIFPRPLLWTVQPGEMVASYPTTPQVADACDAQAPGLVAVAAQRLPLWTDTNATVKKVAAVLGLELWNDTGSAKPNGWGWEWVERRNGASIRGGIHVDNGLEGRLTFALTKPAWLMPAEGKETLERLLPLLAIPPRTRVNGTAQVEAGQVIALANGIGTGNLISFWRAETGAGDASWGLSMDRSIWVMPAGVPVVAPGGIPSSAAAYGDCRWGEATTHASSTRSPWLQWREGRLVYAWEEMETGGTGGRSRHYVFDAVTGQVLEADQGTWAH